MNYLKILIQPFAFSYLLIIALLFVILTITYLRYLILKKAGLKTQGEITGYEAYSNNENAQSFFPIIKFNTHDGLQIHSRTLHGLDAERYVEKGSKVEIIYSKNTPSRFMLAHHNPFVINIKSRKFIKYTFYFVPSVLVLILSIKS